ncbi:tryptophan 2,3-dioxygenase [Streptomyces kronopolitis]|uniref:tryptophan 2,3-dioxygenase n=1 Tax=Streptomyces kronopolitis TaxID=1612435 RepID=UPI0020C17AC8|nr:tryptophan 2,3-dioxygenase family protein [Streptomyces kronopolitis]MCL6299497.1 tryptophan 2,3-dioxygenase family protein [Streptomyces kronopolitis]
MPHHIPEATTLPEADALLPFEGPSPYENYIHASVLSSLQQPHTDAPEEMPFLVTTQVMELWFTLLVHEGRTAREALRKDDYDAAMDALRRSLRAHRALNASWAPIAELTPRQFNHFRGALGTASGFQSVKYRHLEFLLGDKSEAMTHPHRDHSAVHAELCDALTQPSLYDEVLAYLHRQGLPVPAHVLERPRAAPHEPDPGVEEAWRRIYADPRQGALLALGEALTDLAELVQRWRTDHVLVVRRAMGAKTGSGGSSGVHWLEQRAARPVFPELWSARSLV